MGMVFKQLAGTAATALDACNASDHDVAATAKKWGAEADGSTAATQYTLTVPGLSTGASSVVLLAQWESVASEDNDPGLVTVWPAGDWVCRLNVSQANSSVFWDSVEICALHPDGATTTAIASKTGIAESLSSTGTYSETVGATHNTVIPPDSTILWSFYFGQSIASGAGQPFKVRSNKNLATPIGVEAPRAEFRPHIAASRCAASSVSNSEFARSMLEACGSQAWHFGYSMAEQYHAHSMNVTAQAIAAGAARRAGLANASVEDLNAGAASMVREILSAGAAVAGSAGGSSAQRSHISSGARTA